MPKASVFAEIRAEYFPAPLVAEIIARPVAAGVLWTVSSQLDQEIETPSVELGLYEMPAVRRQKAQHLRELYGRLHQEYFVFYNPADEPVGWSYGHMLDESTFFMSWSGVAKADQRRGVYSAFLQSLLPYLYHIGYERVTSKHMVNNRPVLIAKLKAGFHIVGLSMDERFGAQVTLAYFFHQDRRDGFVEAFSLEQRVSPPPNTATPRGRRRCSKYFSPSRDRPVIGNGTLWAACGGELLRWPGLTSRSQADRPVSHHIAAAGRSAMLRMQPRARQPHR